jgi:hypothetical protein
LGKESTDARSGDNRKIQEVETNMLKLSFKFFALGILIGSSLFFYHRPSSSRTEPLRVTVVDQPGAPLLIVPTFVDSGNPLRPRYGYSITNSTDKAIVAYAIQESVSLEPGSPIVTTTLTHLPAKKLLLRPHDSRQEESGSGKTYDKAPIEVRLSVDFVEFADATRWGEDQIRSGERLDGERAGGRAALKKYREVLATDGLNVLTDALANPNFIQPGDSAKSSNWVDGFKTGVSVVKSRLVGAQTKAGREGVRLELEKPYDSTEGRLEPW